MLKNYKKTKIVCTIGPASESAETLKQLIDEGMNVCRLNFSHGSYDEHQARIDTIKKVRSEVKRPIAILLDTKGPEIRTGNFNKDEVTLNAGQKFTITMDDVVGDETKCTVSYKELVDDVNVNDRILIDDGLIELVVLSKDKKDILCEVKNTGIVKNKKGVNVPNVKINLPAITQKDKEDIIFGIKNDIDYIAASFVRKASDVLAIREVLENNGGQSIKIISKIESQEGVDNIDEILEVSDGIMVARGDLGVEIPTEEIPMVQKEIIKKCNSLSKYVITATQMLDSMIRNPRPTRAEVTDVANAIFDGTDAIMLSGETAAGKYPVEAVKTMAKIARATEESFDYELILRQKKAFMQPTITNAISHATCTTAMDLKAKAIITATSGGYTARMVSSYRPFAPIIASTNDEKTYRQMSLYWGVFAILNTESGSAEDVIDSSVQLSLEKNAIEPGDLVVITAGVPVGKSGTTNLLRVHIAAQNLVKGIGVGSSNVSGTARVITSSSQEINEKDIIVTSSTDVDMMPQIKKASAIVTEFGGLTSHAAIVGLNLGIPVIVSADKATQEITDGETITVDAATGIVYKGTVKTL
ncbi:pyruvate kinase [Peptoanaerobacter stomatis]|uniref:Pyruvate kinase n=1 Tax=Peptoanaerobacter stomatis TaxID=796937 RepID=J5WLK0_9FIRM|nr:pyruvate kinase [Peptoanaerobacter stomatis]EJU22852.1 pyruvate kinase [Peptoanaerobacter stomatis]NWO25543.1 pyruvate kinase [Peptostreptococcaceae bacterium oral taxon 081]